MDLIKLLKTSDQNQLGWSLSYADHVISDVNLQKNAETYRDRVWIEKPGERAMPMANVMGEEYNLASLRRMAFPSIAGVKAIRIYTGLDLDTKRVHHFLEPIVILEPIDSGRRTFELPLSSASQFHSDRFEGILYKIEATNVVRIDTDDAQMERFIRLWNNYAECIRFESTLFDAWRLRPFDSGSDTVSCILPFDVFIDVVEDNETPSGFIYTTLSLSSTQYRQNTCLSCRELVTRIRVYSLADLSFRGFSANYAQLCPARCARLKASLVDSANRVFELI